jgi:predicted MFS family arabinose efflux permease
MSTAATVECIFGAAYFGVGRGIGGFIGGFAIDELGTTLTFQMVSALAAATTAIYAVVIVVQKRFCSEKLIAAEI